MGTFVPSVVVPSGFLQFNASKSSIFCSTLTFAKILMSFQMHVTNTITEMQTRNENSKVIKIRLSIVHLRHLIQSRNWFLQINLLFEFHFLKLSHHILSILGFSLDKVHELMGMIYEFNSNKNIQIIFFGLWVICNYQFITSIL